MSPRLTDEELAAYEAQARTWPEWRASYVLDVVAELRRERERASDWADLADRKHRELRALLATAEEQAQVAQALSVELEREREQTAVLAKLLADLVGYCDNCGGSGEIAKDMPCNWCGAARAALDDLGESR